MLLLGVCEMRSALRWDKVSRKVLGLREFPIYEGSYNGVAVPRNGKAIEYSGGKFHIPDNPIIPFIEGDGTGRDIWKASQRVFDAAVEHAYGGKRKIAWFEVFAGEKAFNQFKEWLPQDTVDAIRDFRISIKGPLTTPVGGGIRSLNVALRQLLDLYACVRPVRYFQGVPSPVKTSRAHEHGHLPRKHRRRLHRHRVAVRHARSQEAARIPEQRNAQGRPEADSLGFRHRHQADFADRHQAPGAPRHPVRASNTRSASSPSCTRATSRSSPKARSAIGATSWPATSSARRSSPSARAGSSTTSTRIPDSASSKNAAMIEPGLEQGTEDFRKEAYAEVKKVLDSICTTHGKGQWKKKIMVNDRIADSIFQQIVTRADEYQVLATPNLNGDYISDAAAAQVGGLGMAPGANIGDGYGCFEATHGTAPKYADKDVINPEFGDALRRDDVRLHGLERSRAPDRGRHRAHHRPEARHLRPGTADGGRDEAEDVRIRHGHHREHASRGRRRLSGAAQASARRPRPSAPSTGQDAGGLGRST